MEEQAVEAVEAVTTAASDGNGDVMVMLAVFVLIQIVFMIIGAVRRKKQKRETAAMLEAMQERLLAEVTQQVQSAQAEILAAFKQELAASETRMLQEIKRLFTATLKQALSNTKEAVKYVAESLEELSNNAGSMIADAFAQGNYGIGPKIF
jgi:DNA anti-recombination protein RmuC